MADQTLQSFVIDTIELEAHEMPSAVEAIVSDHEGSHSTSQEISSKLEAINTLLGDRFDSPQELLTHLSEEVFFPYPVDGEIIQAVHSVLQDAGNLAHSFFEFSLTRSAVVQGGDFSPIGLAAFRENCKAQLLVTEKLLELKEKEEWHENITLSSGNNFIIKVPRTRLTEHHFLAYFPGCQGEPTRSEKLEMTAIVSERNWDYAESLLGDSEAYTLLHNGRKTVSFPDTHFHIFIMPDGAEKTEVYRKLYEKNSGSKAK